MLRLVFTVCMIDAPDTCEQREMLVYQPMPVMACVMGAMPELATWTETHPNWRIAGWRCEDDETVQGAAPTERTLRRSPDVARSTVPAPVPVALPH